jgi:voltage-gated sodium channel
MRRVVGALLGALPGIMATFVLLLVVFYIGAVMATMLFPGEEGFADLGQSALTLFALTQFDGWGETIARLQPRYPYAWIFIMGFTIVGAFAVLNLFIGVIVEAVQAAPSKDIGEIKEGVGEMQDDMTGVHQAQESSAQMQQRILAELASLRAEVASLRGAPPTPAE